jgi:hypothetical protein
VSLRSLAPLLPTPTATDAKNGRNRTAGRSNPDSKHHDGLTLSDWAHLHGVPTPRPSTAGSTSPAAGPLTLWTAPDV